MRGKKNPNPESLDPSSLIFHPNPESLIPLPQPPPHAAHQALLSQRARLSSLVQLTRFHPSAQQQAHLAPSPALQKTRLLPANFAALVLSGPRQRALCAARTARSSHRFPTRPSSSSRSLGPFHRGGARPLACRQGQGQTDVGFILLLHFRYTVCCDHLQARPLRQSLATFQPEPRISVHSSGRVVRQACQLAPALPVHQFGARRPGAPSEAVACDSLV